MTFSNKIYELQGKYPRDIILIKNGIFFVAVGKDALFLNEKLKPKCTCFGNEICKVGFLVKSAENYINNNCCINYHKNAAPKMMTWQFDTSYTI